MHNRISLYCVDDINPFILKIAYYFVEKPIAIEPVCIVSVHSLLCLIRHDSKQLASHEWLCAMCLRFKEIRMRSTQYGVYELLHITPNIDSDG